MPNVDDVLALVAGHKWVALAAVVIGLVVRLLKDDTALPTIKARWRPWAAIGLGIVAGVLEKVSDGMAWKPALLGGLFAAVAAIVGHDLLIEGVRGGKELPVWPAKLPPSAGVGGAVFALLLVGCALFSPKGALFGLHAAECVISNALEHPELKPEEIALKCGEQVSPELIDLVTKTRASQARANASKATAPACVGDAGASDGAK